MHNAEYLTIEGRLAFVEIFGTSGPAVVCVHTAGQSGVQFRAAAPAIADLGYRVIVADMPGHGRSEPAIGGPVGDMGRYADFYLEVIDQLDLSSPYLLGCSIGGSIVLDMAIKASDKLAGVIAMCAMDYQTAGRPPRPMYFEDSASPAIRDRTYYGAIESCGLSTPPETVEMIAQMHCREDWHVTYADGTAQGRLDLKSRLHAITCPTMVLAGEDDPFFPPRLIQPMTELIPGAQYQVLYGVGHYPMEEMSDFADHFATWMTALQTEPAL